MRRSTSFPSRIARGLVRVLLPVSLLSLAACPRASDSSVGSPLNLKGTYVHAGSSIRFPASVAAFARTAPRRYDKEGKDVGIGYVRTIDGVRVEATIFVFPPPRHEDGREFSSEEQFAGEIDELRVGKTELREIARGIRQETYAGNPVAVRMAEFEFRGQAPLGTSKHGVATLLTSFPAGAWRITYRVTVPRASRDAAWAAVEELVKALGLPPTGSTVAAPSGRGSEKK